MLMKTMKILYGVLFLLLLSTIGQADPVLVTGSPANPFFSCPAPRCGFNIGINASFDSTPVSATLTNFDNGLTTTFRFLPLEFRNFPVDFGQGTVVPLGRLSASGNLNTSVLVGFRMSFPGGQTELTPNGTVNTAPYYWLVGGRVTYSSGSLSFTPGGVFGETDVIFTDRLWQTNFGIIRVSNLALDSQGQLTATISRVNSAELPEPATLVLLGTGLTGLIIRRRKASLHSRQ